MGISIKIKNNSTVYLSKFLFLKNPKKPNGNKTKNIGKIDNPTDSIREFIPRYIVELCPIVDAAAMEWLAIPSYPIVFILTNDIGNETSRKIEIARKYLGIFFLYFLFSTRNKTDNGISNTIAS
jgi:hypothetical protein